jgi:hypothetical protein
VADDRSEESQRLQRQALQHAPTWKSAAISIYPYADKWPETGVLIIFEERFSISVLPRGERPGQCFFATTLLGSARWISYTACRITVNTCSK